MRWCFPKARGYLKKRFSRAVKRRNMKAAKPARRSCRKPMARTVGWETGLFKQELAWPFSIMGFIFRR